MTEPPRGSVFVGHSSADAAFARRLASDLETLGIRVWFDEWELRVGDSLVGRIKKGIQVSRWMIVVLSPVALRSKWVRRELRIGLTREVGSAKVFVLLALCKRVSLPPFLSDKFYADFSRSYDTGLRLIKDRIDCWRRMPFAMPTNGC